MIVLNGLTEADICDCLETQHPLVTWINTGSSIGAGSARNVGVRALEVGARALLFCDADDQVSANWLAELSTPLLDGSADLVGGALRVRGPDGGSALVLPRVDYWHLQAVFGANMGMTYQVWSRLGGFDESFVCCEDTDLTWRASDAGLRMQIVPKAIADYTFRSPLQELRQRFRWGRSSVKLLRTHGVPLHHLPGLRSLITDKSASGFATMPILAAIAQWAGQWAGRWVKG